MVLNKKEILAEQNKNISVEVNIKPLSINRAWQGRKYRTKEYKAYQEEMHYLLPNKEMIKGKIAVFLTFYLKNPTQCDVDNFIKPILDIFKNKGYIEDDRNVYFVQATKEKDTTSRIKIDIVKL